MNIVKKPNKGTLIVEPVSNEQVTESGIIITEAFETELQKAKVLFIGELSYKELCKPGDFIFMRRHTGIDIGFGELHIHESQVLFTMEK